MNLGALITSICKRAQSTNKAAKYVEYLSSKQDVMIESTDTNN